MKRPAENKPAEKTEVKLNRRNTLLSDVFSLLL